MPQNDIIKDIFEHPEKMDRIVALIAAGAGGYVSWMIMRWTYGAAKSIPTALDAIGDVAEKYKDAWDAFPGNNPVQKAIWYARNPQYLEEYRKRLRDLQEYNNQAFETKRAAIQQAFANGEITQEEGEARLVAYRSEQMRQEKAFYDQYISADPRR